MNRILRNMLLFLVAVPLSVPAVCVWAADTGTTDQKTISSNSIARLVIGKGTTWVRSGDSGDWEEASGNFPVAERARVSVPRDSEAKIQFRGSQILSLKGGSEVDIRKLGEKEVIYRLRSGDAVLSLPKEDFAPVRINVPGNREVRVDSPGQYSLSTDQGLTKFHVRAGEGAVASKEGSPITVKAGEVASIGEEIRVSRADAGTPETAREPVLTEAEQESGIPSTAATELRQYGDWVWTSEYGYVWRPYVEGGWEPYDYGRWTWVDPYGWTWVGYEPWGWWPYHYGWWWPSPAFGWVWCPFNSFVSVDFFFGGHVFNGHHAAFFPGNVRFVGRGGFVRWVPARPGVVETRNVPFARTDARLAGWNRPVERGSVMMRGAGGRTVAWEGRGGNFQGAGTRAGAGMSRTTLRNAGPSVSRTRDGAAVRGGQGGPGSAFRNAPRGTSRPSAIGRGGGADRSGSFRSPMRSTIERAPSSAPRGGFERGFSGGGSRGGGGSFEGFSGGGSRGGGGGGQRMR